MTTRIRTKIAKTTLSAAVIAAVAAPGAAAAPSTGTRITIPPSLAGLREPGSTGYVPTTTVTIPPRLANFREPGSTGFVPVTAQVTIPARLANFREPGSTGYVPSPVAVTPAASVGGLDWTSALIGAGAGLGIALVCAGGLLVARKRRALAHV
jgi:hypothetical protein